MLHLRARRVEHRHEQHQRDHRATVLPRSGCFENHQRNRRDDKKCRQWTLLEEADAILPLAQKIREKKYQREFRELHLALADIGARASVTIVRAPPRTMPKCGM